MCTDDNEGYSHASMRDDIRITNVTAAVGSEGIVLSRFQSRHTNQSTGRTGPGCCWGAVMVMHTGTVMTLLATTVCVACVSGRLLAPVFGRVDSLMYSFCGKAFSSSHDLGHHNTLAAHRPPPQQGVVAAASAGAACISS